MTLVATERGEVGAQSLLVDSFECCVAGLRQILSMIPGDAEPCQLRFLVELNRLLSWRKATSDNLNDKALIYVCGILARVTSRLSAFRDEIFLQHVEAAPDSARDCATLEDPRWRKSTIAEYLRTKAVRVSEEPTIHFDTIKLTTASEHALAEMGELVHFWLVQLQHLAAFDHEELRETSARAYQEILLALRTVASLEAMETAVAPYVVSGQFTDEVPDAALHETFGCLLPLKKTALRTEEALHAEIKPILSFNVQRYTMQEFCDHFAQKDEGHRPHARELLKQTDGGTKGWVEWRELEAYRKGSPKEFAVSLRAIALAEMLHASSSSKLWVPRCIGFVDNTRIRQQTFGDGQYGWVFAMPEGCSPNASLRSLHSMLEDDSVKRPTLTERVELAKKLAWTVSRLHAAGWLHHAIRSDNVVFVFDEGGFSVEQPILSGFDFPRFSTNETIEQSLEPIWDIYLWPGIQNKPPRPESARKTYDIYSLGLVLMEVAHWKPLHRLLSLTDWPDCDPNAIGWIRAWLMGDEEGPFEVNPLDELRQVVPDRYWKVVSRCIIAYGEHGLRLTEDEDGTSPVDVKVAMKQHAAFNKLVVDQLRSVSV